MSSLSHIDIMPGGGLRHLLSINETGANPEYINNEMVIPVVEMSMGGHLRLNDNNNHRRKFTLYSSTGGERTFNIPLVEYGNATGPSAMVYDVGFNFRLMCVNGLIYIADDAYRAAYSGRQLVYELNLNLNTVGGTGNYIHVCSGLVSIGSNNPYITFSNLGLDSLSSQSRNLIIPAGSSLDFGMFTNSRTAGGSSFLFPAAAGDLTVSLQYGGIQVPIGAPIPSFY